MSDEQHQRAQEERRKLGFYICLALAYIVLLEVLGI